jgi:hypothetical protein
MAWVTPIYDRTLADVTGRTSKAYFNVADWSRIYGNIDYLHDLFVTMMGVDVTLAALTTPTITTIPTVADINALIEEIDLLRQATSFQPSAGVVPLIYDYQAGNMVPSPSYISVNDWEKDLDLMRVLLLRMSDDLISCGVASCGQAHFWQARFHQF